MIFAYGVTQQGAYHVKNNIVCQDSHKIVKVSDRMIVVAVADGLGSEEHSDIASKIASEFSVDYCANNISIEFQEEEILEVIKDSFELAQKKIEQTAIENGHELDQYDTTLSLAILIDDQLFYGHSGDSGIIAMTTDGKFHKVTEQQRDSDGRVLPLFFGEEKWVIEKYAYSVVSVFLATDGMFEILFPIYIRDEEISIYTALARYFMDPQFLGIENVGEKTIQEKISCFMDNIPANQVNDDKTVVVIMNSLTKFTLQPDEYYAEPDWVVLKKRYEDAWKKAAYPHLFKEDNPKKEEKSDLIHKYNYSKGCDNDEAKPTNDLISE